MNKYELLRTTFGIPVYITYIRWDRYLNLLRMKSDRYIENKSSAIYLASFIEMISEEERSHMFKILTHVSTRNLIYEITSSGFKSDNIFDMLFNNNSSVFTDEVYKFFFRLQKRFVAQSYVTYGSMDIYDLINKYEMGCEKFNYSILEDMKVYMRSILTDKEKKIIKQRIMEEKLEK